MAMSLDSEPEKDPIPGEGELLPQAVVVYSPEKFSKGKCRLQIEDADGKEIASLRANPQSNTNTEAGDIQSYTLSFSNGYDFLLPVPTLFNSAEFARIWPDEESRGAKQWLEEVLNYTDQHFGIKISDVGVAVENLSDKKVYRSLPQGPVAQKNRMVSGRDGLYWKNDIAGPGVFSGKINGGRPVYALTVRKAGFCDKYPKANEDSIGIGIENGVMVVADGLGGGAFGECASSIVVESILNSREKLIARRAIDAHERLYIFNRHMYFTTGRAGDSVMAAVQVVGDEFKTVSIGDTRWVLIRGGRIIKKSPIRSLVGALLETGRISPAEALTHPARNIVDTVMLGNFLPDVDSGKMEEGDIFMVFDDGVGMTDKEIEQVMSEEGVDPFRAAKKIIARTRERNLLGEDEMQTGDGEFVKAPAPRDNLGLIIYRHDKG